MKYFAYGSNMNLNHFFSRCSNIDSKPMLLGKACLKDYKLTFDKYSRTWQGGVADIVKSEESEVWGLLYEVKEAHLKRLDTYEGHPNFYKRIEIEIVSADNTMHSAITYEVVLKDSFIPPSQAYLKIILDAARKFKYPKYYIQYVNSLVNDVE